MPIIVRKNGRKVEPKEGALYCRDGDDSYYLCSPQYGNLLNRFYVYRNGKMKIME